MAAGLMQANPVTGNKNITDIVLRDLAFPEKPPLVLASPNQASFNKGKSVEEIVQASRMGETVLADIIPKESKPQIQVTFPTKTPTTVGLSMGQRPKKITDGDTWISASALLLNQQVYAAATAAGEEGYGVEADPAAAIASYLDDDGISQPITRVATAGTPPSGTATWSVGANNLRQFSADLVGRYITYDIPVAGAAMVYLSEKPFDRFSLTLVQITRHLKVIRFHCPSVTVRVDQGDINFSEQPIQVTFSVNYDGSECYPWTWEWLDMERSC